jgi:hypothetical protein
MAWRITDWLSEHPSVERTDDNTCAVCAVLAAALKIVLDALAGPADEPASDAGDGK